MANFWGNRALSQKNEIHLTKPENTMAFSSNYRSWRTVAIATLMHENADHASENNQPAAVQPATKLPVKSVKTIGYWIKNIRHAA